eukprot:7511208-Lingulodinium_polyedra.AAC.1
MQPNNNCAWRNKRCRRTQTARAAERTPRDCQQNVRPRNTSKTAARPLENNPRARARTRPASARTR